jgi:hypothetical protein
VFRDPGREGYATAVEYCVNRSAVGEHQEDSCGLREHVSRLSSNIRTGRCKNLSFGTCAVPDQEPRTGLDECQRHGLAHRTKADEADRIGCVRHTIFDATGEQLRKSRSQPARAGSRLLGLPPLRQILLGQRRSGRLGLHHDAHNSPAAGFFDSLNAVNAARDLLAVGVQRVAAP